jgi:hypothetical protein
MIPVLLSLTSSHLNPHLKYLILNLTLILTLFISFRVETSSSDSDSLSPDDEDAPVADYIFDDICEDWDDGHKSDDPDEDEDKNEGSS